jgi:hypothetical protein
MAMRPRSRDRRVNKAREAAGNGLLDRRVFLTGGAGALAAGAFMAFAPSGAGAAAAPETPTWMTPRRPFSGMGHRPRERG